MAASIADIAEPGVIDGPDLEPDDDLPRLLSWYEESERSQHIARDKAERDRDYVDNKQLTQDEIDKLTKRGQPAIALNLVRSRAAFLGGMEKKQRRDPKAYPRNNPEDADAAEAFTDGMRYVVERADYPSKRSQAWKNITIEGFGGIELAAVPNRDGGFDFTVNRIPWDRAFYDPHSSEPDFSDARYFGQVLWMDYDEAVARAVQGGYVDEATARQILDTTISGANSGIGFSRTYDDKPRWNVWADTRRKRVRIVMMWHREPDGWKYCEFTKSGKIAYADGPYVDQDGETYCPWLFESGNVDRENNRYGELRHLIDPQDEVNKRRSKGLHQAVSRGVIASEGAVKDTAATRRELAKPDFYIEINPGAEKFEIVDGQQLAAGQAQLAAEAMNYMMQAGPNAALMGKGTEDQSGRAIEAQQAGGLVEQSDLMDTLRRLDLRVFNVIASMMKQFWDAETWIRVTDDDETPRYIGLNEPMWTDPATGQTAPESHWKEMSQQGQPFGQLVPAQHPETGEPMRNNDVARLDLDVMVSDAPSTIALDGESYQAFVELMKAGLPPPALKIAIEMNPALPAKRKKQLSDMLDQMQQQPPPPAAQKAQDLKIEQAEAEIVATRAAAYLDLTAGETNMAKIGVSTQAVPVPDIAEGGFGAFGAPQGPPGAPPTPPPPQPPTSAPGPGPAPILHPSSHPGDAAPMHAPAGPPVSAPAPLPPGVGPGPAPALQGAGPLAGPRMVA